MDSTAKTTGDEINITITRLITGNDGTFGKLDIAQPRWQCATLEQPYRDNKPAVSRIPAGIYRAVWQWSPRLQRCTYRLLDVPGRTGILIHPANFAGDRNMNWYSELMGCISLGSHVQKLRNPLGDMQKAVFLSRHTVAEFEALCDQKPLLITIKNEKE